MNPLGIILRKRNAQIEWYRHNRSISKNVPIVWWREKRKIERMTNWLVCNGIQFNTHRIRLDAHDDHNDDGTHTHLWKMRRKKLRIVYEAEVS